jgi:ribonuclease HI
VTGKPTAWRVQRATGNFNWSGSIAIQERIRLDRSVEEFFLLTDGSVNTQTNTGYGAYLTLTKDECSLPVVALKTRIKVQKFEQTSSTKLELQTLLWALSELPDDINQLTVYTDSQNIVNLAGRRERFEAHDYHSKKGLPLRNAELYQAYFEVTDRLQFKLVKVKGHKSARKRNQIDQLFALVDKASRKARRARKQELCDTGEFHFP